MDCQTTIRKVIVCSGRGIHTGEPTFLQMLPAPAGTGINFRRRDLKNSSSIPATGNNIYSSNGATTLGPGYARVSTTEHLLSAFLGLGIDNVTIELDNCEVPIVDGSSMPFVSLILKAGIRKQNRSRTYIGITTPIEVCKGDGFMRIYPAPELSISCSIDYPHPLVGRQFLDIAISPPNYILKIAPARTFLFPEQSGQMRREGLIKGASDENTLMFSKEELLNGPLRFPDEIVRHKVLDILGDFALLGAPLQARVIAHRSGHALHAATVGAILRKARFIRAA